MSEKLSPDPLATLVLLYREMFPSLPQEVLWELLQVTASVIVQDLYPRIMAEAEVSERQRWMHKTLVCSWN